MDITARMFSLFMALVHVTGSWSQMFDTLTHNKVPRPITQLLHCIFFMCNALHIQVLYAHAQCDVLCQQQASPRAFS